MNTAIQTLQSEIEHVEHVMTRIDIHEHEDEWNTAVERVEELQSAIRFLKEQTRMNTYTCTQFSGFWPVGSAAVAVANTPEEAATLINQQLKEIGLPGDAEEKDMVPMDISKPHAVILLDGNY